MKNLLPLFLLLSAAFAQVQVAPAPPLHPRFVDNAGNPLASGFLYTYLGGTTTPLNTYIDSTGTIQNTNPIPLDASGAPTNGSVQTQIWLANNTYKFCAVNAGLVQQWCVDGIQSYLGFLNVSNIWTFGQTFTQPITDTSIDNQFNLGAVGNQTVLDFPPPSGGGALLHFPNASDTIVGRTTTDTLTNKSLTLPFINSATIQNSPGSYISIPNGNPTGTSINSLVSMSGNTAVITPAGSQWGALGICVTNCGTSGSGDIQTSGAGFCAFDNSVTAGDYVTISQILNGACHDAGTVKPSGSESIGIALQSLASGSANVVLFPSTNTSGAICSLPVQTISTVGTSSTVINSCSVGTALNALNRIGQTIRISGDISTAPASSMAQNVVVNLNGTNMVIATGTSASGNDSAFIVTCTVTTVGASGVLSCNNQVSSSNSSITNAGPFQAQTVNLSTGFSVSSACFFGSAAANSCTAKQFVVEQIY